MGHALRPIVFLSLLLVQTFGKPLNAIHRVRNAPGEETDGASAPILDEAAEDGTSVSSSASDTQSFSSVPTAPSVTDTSNPTTIANSTDNGGTVNIGIHQPGYAIVNPKNVSCADTRDQLPVDIWSMVGGNEVMKSFEDMYSSDALICPDCFAKPKAQCQSSSGQCSRGIRTLSGDGDIGNSRYDAALAYFSTGQSNIHCSLGPEGQCMQGKDCGDTIGPGAWAMREQMVNLHNYFEANYEAITQARDAANTQMRKFSDKFAPIPDKTWEKIGFNIVGDIVGGLLGSIPVVGSALSTSAAIAKDALSAKYMGNPQLPADTASILGTIANTGLQYLDDLAGALFKDGEYRVESKDGSQPPLRITMRDLFQSGQYMKSTQNIKTTFKSVTSKYETILLQSTLLYTWTNLNGDKLPHHPYIAFERKPCDQVDANDKSGLEQLAASNSAMPFKGLSGLDVGVTVNGTCYYLLDANPSGAVGKCNPKAFPAGTNKDMGSNGATFAGLSLQDFIIPAVSGWEQNGKQNKPVPPPEKTGFVTDPHAPWAVNIPVCDYLGDSTNPGGNCPMLYGGGTLTDAGCPVSDYSGQPNAPGKFMNGWCRLHFVQWQKNEGNDNPLNDYQLSVNIFDDGSRLIGQVPKQSTSRPIEIGQSVLPFHLIAATGAVDDDPVSFWYSDQYWDSRSTANHCLVGGWDGGSRSGDCGFQCPMAFNDTAPPVSATSAHALPTAPTKAVGNPTQFVNTWSMASSYIAPTPTANAPPEKPTYTTGWCTFHLRQWQKNEGQDNPTGDYQIEVTLYDGSSPPKAVGSSGKVQAPQGQPVSVQGLGQPLNITARAVDQDPMDIAWGSQKFDTHSELNHCQTGEKWDGYENGRRDIDCGFTC